MVMLNVNDKQLARIAETLSSTQRDIRIANTRALTSTRRKAQAQAMAEYRKTLGINSAKSRIGGRKIGQDYFIVTISGRAALISSFKGVKGKRNAPVKSYPRSFWQYSRKDKSRLLPLARRTPRSRNDLEVLTVDLNPLALETRKQVEGKVAGNYSQEFERVLVSRRQNA